MLFYIQTALKGFCMGAADVVPGVSGGTMAFILGIYQRLIDAIKSFDLEFMRLALSLQLREAAQKTDFAFLVSLGIGILMAIFSLAKLISWLLVNQPVLIWSFFFGLILASIYTVTKHIEKWSVALFIASAAAAIFAYILVGAVPMKTPETSWFLFLSGAVAICAMILPGISGSFILVLLGKYHYILEAVNQRDLITLSIVACGAVLGLMLFSRLLSWLFKHFHDLTIAILCGLMAGSLRKVWPFKTVDQLSQNTLPDAFTVETLTALGLATAAVIMVLLLERTAGAK